MNIARPMTTVTTSDEGGPFPTYRVIGLISCEVCGAAIIVDEDDHAGSTQRHNEWHESLDRRINEALQVGAHGDMMTRVIG